MPIGHTATLRCGDGELRPLPEGRRELNDAVDFRFQNPLVREKLRLGHRWAALTAEHVVMLHPKLYDFSLHSGQHYLALVNASRKDAEATPDDLLCSALEDIQGKLIFVPAGSRLQGWLLPGTTPIALTAAYLDPKVCPQPDAGELQLSPMLHFEHPFLVQMMLQLDRMLEHPENYSHMYAESLAVVLLSEIMNCQAVNLPQPSLDRWPPIRGGLASWQCKAVCDYMEANLQQNISLAELAAIARLSPYHFCRAFKESIGEPPHRYQMGRRIAKAKTLLAKPVLSVSDVAATVGYGSLSRFSALFRQVTGLSPRNYRRMMA